MANNCRKNEEAKIWYKFWSFLIVTECSTRIFFTAKSNRSLFQTNKYLTSIPSKCFICRGIVDYYGEDIFITRLVNFESKFCETVETAVLQSILQSLMFNKEGLEIPYCNRHHSLRKSLLTCRCIISLRPPALKNDSKFYLEAHVEFFF